MSLLLRLAYDGTDYSGFARQPGQPHVRTVQGELERAMALAYASPVQTRGASRTDAAVHAEGQLVAFDPPEEGDARGAQLPPEGVVGFLRGRLPATVTAVSAWEEPGVVDPRHGNGGKRYRYRIRCARTPNPMTARFEWHLGKALDVVAMHRAAASLVGEHDFASFRAADCQSQHSVRRIDRVRVAGRGLRSPDVCDHRAHDGPAEVVIDVEGTAFLKNMVRIVVGTLVDVGLGRTTEASVGKILRAKDRTHAGMTAPARGLCLVEVRWPGERGRS